MQARLPSKKEGVRKPRTRCTRFVFRAHLNSHSEGGGVVCHGVQSEGGCCDGHGGWVSHLRMGVWAGMQIQRDLT